FDDVAIVPTFILTPLTYLGGVFYSVKLLPPWAEAATHANPIFYMVNAFRYGLLGSTDVPLWVAYALMLCFVAALSALSLTLLRRGVGRRSCAAAGGFPFNQALPRASSAPGAHACVSFLPGTRFIPGGSPRIRTPSPARRFSLWTWPRTGLQEALANCVNKTTLRDTEL